MGAERSPDPVREQRTDENGTLASRIAEWKQRRNAVILAHNYQVGEVQDVADFIGDSLQLSLQAAQSAADVIVFCGVHFMAETAAILAPAKTVLLPAADADCPMARMVDAERLRRLKGEHPSAQVVCYVNTTAEVKAECDICCTSSNAAQVVGGIARDQEIIFVPDQYLGQHVAQLTQRPLILWPGYCPTHVSILPQHILERKREHPAAKVIVHPECRPEVAALADAVLSTGGMCRYARESDAREFIVGTEIGMLYRLRKDNPGKSFIAATEQAVCPNMKLTTIEDVLWSLQEMRTRVTVPEPIRRRAESAVRRMLEVSA